MKPRVWHEPGLPQGLGRSKPGRDLTPPPTKGPCRSSLIDIGQNVLPLPVRRHGRLSGVTLAQVRWRSGERLVHWIDRLRRYTVFDLAGEADRLCNHMTAAPPFPRLITLNVTIVIVHPTKPTRCCSRASASVFGCAGNCSTVAAWPSRNSVSNTMRPSGNSSAS